MSSTTHYTTASPRDRILTVSLVIFCQIVHGISFSAMPLLLPLIREDLHITFTQAGLLSAAATFSYALGQSPAGFLSDRYGPKRLFFIGLLGWSAFSVLLGLIHIFWLAVISQLLAGAFRALLFAPGMSLLASWFPAERRATAMSLYMLGGFAGTIVLSLGGPLLTAAYGWRAAFMMMAAIGIAAAFIYRHYAREKPRTGTAQHLTLTDVAQLFSHSIMWVCSGLQFVRFAVVTAYMVWLPSLLVVDRGLSVQQAGFIVAMAAAFTAPSNTLGGYVSDRLRNPPLIIGGALDQVSSYWMKPEWLASLKEHYKSDPSKLAHITGDDSYSVQLLTCLLHCGPHGKHFVMVFEILGVNLLEVIKRYNYKGVPMPLVRILAK